QILGAAAAALTAPARALAAKEIEIHVAPVSANTFRLTVFGESKQVPDDGCLVQSSWGAPIATLRADSKAQTVKAGGVAIEFAPDPLRFRIAGVQELKVDPESGVLSFQTGTAPILGLGEGGPGFDRRGNSDRMRSGQGGYQLRTFGGKVPIAWLIGTGGWAMFVHTPYGSFGLPGAEGKFIPPAPEQALPLDGVLVASKSPPRITGAGAG